MALAGTRHVRLRHASVARVMPELLGLFPGEVTDSWRAKRTMPPARLGITPAAGPVPIRAAVFVHVDPGYRELVDEPGDTLVHRLNLYENAVRYIRGGEHALAGRGQVRPVRPAAWTTPPPTPGAPRRWSGCWTGPGTSPGRQAAVAERISALVTSGAPVTAQAGWAIQ